MEKCKNCGCKTRGVQLANQFAGKTLCLACWNLVYGMNWEKLLLRKQRKKHDSI